jgi:hypothetical protein
MRTLEPAVIAAIESGGLPVATLVEIVFPSQTIRLNSSNWTLTWDGHEYLGAAGLGEISEIVDQGGELPGLQLELQNITSDLVILALDQEDEVQGSPVEVSTAFFDPATYQILDVEPDWTGRADTMPVSEDGERGAVVLRCENKGVDLLRGTPLFYNNPDQQSLYPGDRAFEYVNSQADQPVVWPKREWYFR